MKNAISTKLFSARLIGCRNQRHWAQQELANALDCSLRSVQGWERDGRLPHGSMLRKLAAVLGVDIAYLTGEKNDMTPSKAARQAYALDAERAHVRQLRTVMATFKDADLVAKARDALAEPRTPEAERANRAKPFIDELVRRGGSSLAAPSAAAKLLARASGGGSGRKG